MTLTYCTVCREPQSDSKLKLVTWWGVLVGFVGALAGTWGGQLIASRREDRRWARERDREDLRHAREIEKLQTQHDREVDKLRLEHRREVDLAWRSERRATYIQFLNALLTWEGKAYALTKSEGLPRQEGEHAQVQQWYNELNEHFTILMLSGSPAVCEVGQEALGACAAIARQLRSSVRPGPDTAPDLEAAAQAVTDVIYKFAETCRSELELI